MPADNVWLVVFFLFVLMYLCVFVFRLLLVMLQAKGKTVCAQARAQRARADIEQQLSHWVQPGEEEWTEVMRELHQHFHTCADQAAAELSSARLLIDAAEDPELYERAGTTCTLLLASVLSHTLLVLSEEEEGFWTHVPNGDGSEQAQEMAAQAWEQMQRVFACITQPLDVATPLVWDTLLCVFLFLFLLFLASSRILYLYALLCAACGDVFCCSTCHWADACRQSKHTDGHGTGSHPLLFVSPFFYLGDSFQHHLVMYDRCRLTHGSQALDQQQQWIRTFFSEATPGSLRYSVLALWTINNASSLHVV